MNESSSDPTPPPLPPAVTSESIVPESARNRPWGFWATLAWSLVIVVSYFVVQVVVVFGYWLVGLNRNADVGSLTIDGTLLAIVTLLGAPVVAGLCVVFARLRKGISLVDYLGLIWPPPKAVRWWCIGLLILSVASDSVTALLGRPWVPEVMVSIYRNTAWLPLLWIALVVGAPLGEEVFFRGFLFRGLQHSALGGHGAIVVTSAAWALIHMQYDFYGMLTIFVAGIFLGYARLKTGSLWLCMLLHAIMNTLATVQIELYLGFTKT